MTTAQKQQTFQVQGLDCPDCARSLETGVSKLEGVISCELNFNTGKLNIIGDVPADSVIRRVQEFGHDVAEPEARTDTSQPHRPQRFLEFMWRRRDTRLALIGALLILPGLVLEETLGISHFIIDIFSLAALLMAAGPIYRSAFQALRVNHEVNINVLMSIASIGAVVIGAYTEAGMVMVLFAIGEALEGYAANRSRDSIRSLMEVVPNSATLLVPQNGSFRTQQVKVNALQIGDRLLVKPGERIPMDGEIISGASSVNQAPITGESSLIGKQPGDAVFASSINGEGPLEILVTHLAEDNTISRVIKMVEEAQEKRAPAQRFVDQFARFYTPFIVALAVVVMFVPPLFFGLPFLNPDPDTFGWFYRGLALLVVGCPCALVISTPVSLISAISNAARNGVLIKGGAHLETLSRVQAIAFDKTGTLTQGRPAVVSIYTPDCTCQKPPDGIRQSNYCLSCQELLALVSAVEEHSEHPLAQAVIQEAEQRQLRDKYPPAQTVSAMTGRGITGQVGDQTVMVSSHNHFHEIIPEKLAHHEIVEAETRKGHTPLLVTVDGIYRGTISVADTLRPTSQAALTHLKELGMKALVMLSGDNQAAAEVIGEQIGITDIRAELLPENKIAAVEELIAAYGSVAMIGDGINDAPALARADVGIAIGAAQGGTAQALETADIALMSDNLERIPFTLKLSKAAMRTIRVNVGFAIAIKFAFLILVLMGLGTMWMAVFADMGASLLVTLNALRLLKRPQPSL